MTSEEKMREEFEAWFQKEYGKVSRCGIVSVHDLKETFWYGWKASRESLVIELPEMDWLGDDETGEFGYTEYSIRESIHAAGVKTK